MNQVLLPFSGEELRDGGMQVAIEHADLNTEGWSDMAYDILKKFLSLLPAGQKFMTEEVRAFADKEGLPTPPSNRAWGAIIARASKKDHLIIHAGFAAVSNPAAHRTPASVWMKTIPA